MKYCEVHADASCNIICIYYASTMQLSKHNYCVLYFDLRSVVHRRMKLMVVGRHGRGKTTLVRALRDGGALRRSKLKTVSTRGVDVQCWCSVTRSTKPFQKAPPPINFCVWDFGGQVGLVPCCVPLVH